MLIRQRVTLQILQKSHGSISRLKLTKLLFLLEQEFPSRGGNAFYQFVPYKYGPFSFSFMKEVEQLMKDGLIAVPDARFLRLTDAGQKMNIRLDSNIVRDIEALICSYGKVTDSELIDQIYERYPWYTLNSQIPNRGVVSRPSAPLAVYTMGYEGLQVEKFLNRLLIQGITTIIDVRKNAWSRRFGFHGSTLSRLAAYLGIDYLHFPDLGISSEERARISQPDDRLTLFNAYTNLTLSRYAATVHNVAEILLSQPSVLVCLEADPLQCHRSRLAKALALETGLPIINF